MGSRVIQFVQQVTRGPGVYELKCHTTVADLTHPEWVVIEGVVDWLRQRKQVIVVNITQTRALSGDLLSLPVTLAALADQFDYEAFEEENATLSEHGIIHHRGAASPDPLQREGEAGEA